MVGSRAMSAIAGTSADAVWVVGSFGHRIACGMAGSARHRGPDDLLGQEAQEFAIEFRPPVCFGPRQDAKPG